MTKRDRECLAKKFDYIIYEDYIQVSQVMKAFDYEVKSRDMIRKFRDTKTGSSLQPAHIKLLEIECDIPKTIFAKMFDFNTENINREIENFREKKRQKEKENFQYIKSFQNEIEILKKQKQNKNIQHTFPFYKKNKLLTNLTGIWYAYSYGTSPKDGINGIYTIETTIHNDQTVTDINGNQGRVFLGHNQSTIIKESSNSRDLVTIVFNNTEVPYGRFHFTILSKRNGVRQSMCNFGFFSKEKLNEEEYIKILGDKIDEMQLQMNSKFEERVLG